MEIPLFPLPTLVLFPHALVPLHIFEERYKLMINTCIDRDEVFGVILLRAGAETESEETIHRVGVTARIVQVERLDSGRMNILTEGEDRFRIHRFTQQEPYWKGLVDFIRDDDSPHAVDALSREVSERYRTTAALSAKLNSTNDPKAVLSDSPSELSYMISHVLDIEPEDKQKLLEMKSSFERLRALLSHLDESIQKLEQQLALKQVITKVRGNGNLGRPRT
jgi:Lon protease-like protein